MYVCDSKLNTTSSVLKSMGLLHRSGSKLGVLPATFGGDLTVTAEVYSAGTAGNHWSRIVDLQVHVPPPLLPT